MVGGVEHTFDVVAGISFERLGGHGAPHEAMASPFTVKIPATETRYDDQRNPYTVRFPRAPASAAASMRGPTLTPRSPRLSGCRCIAWM